jgi:hypothetical protein
VTVQQPFTVSPHALQRALEMGITGEEIRRTFENPDRHYWSQKHQKWTYVRGRIALGMSEDQSCIVTVLWSTQDGWLAEYERGTTHDRQERSLAEMQHLRRQA